MWVGARRAAYELPIEQGLKPIELFVRLSPPDAESHGCQNRRWSPEPLRSFQTFVQQQPRPAFLAAHAAHRITIDVVKEQAGALCTHTDQPQERQGPGTQAQVYRVEEL